LDQTSEEKARAALVQSYNAAPARGPSPNAVPSSDPDARARMTLERMRIDSEPAAATSVAATVPTDGAPAAAASPAEMTQQQKLREILNLYVADQITPREYHDRRAKILAGN
jgi:hypothetical protein